jgi:DNA-binding XRE family transcriptional regulator
LTYAAPLGYTTRHMDRNQTGRERLAPVRTRDIRVACGVSRQTIHAWRTGRSRPSLEAMLRLRELFGIPVEAWAKEA